MRLWGAVVLAFGLVLPACAEPLHIGVGAPLSGPDAVFGDQIRLGVEQAIVDIDAAGGFLGQSAELVRGDDGGDPKKGDGVARRFVAAHVPIVVGHFSSAVTVPASAIYADAGALDLTPSAIEPLVTDRGLATVFRTCGRSDEQAGVAARFLLHRTQSKIAILHDRTSDGKALADAVRKELAAADVHEVFYGSFEKGSHDLAGFVSRLKASGAQIAFWGGGASDAATLVRQIRDTGARITLMGGMAIASDELADAGAAADGTLMVFAKDPRRNPAAADLLKRLQAKGIDPDGTVFYAYAAVEVVKQAADAAHALDPVKLAGAMHSGMTFRTVLGNLAFDAKGDPKTPDFTVYVWHRGASGRMTYDDPANF